MIGMDTYSEIIFLKIYMIEEIKIQNFPKTRLNHQKGKNYCSIYVAFPSAAVPDVSERSSSR